jgi:UDP-glucose:(glucosyl)LPS alpha-1,2-glucosyltransferase
MTKILRMEQNELSKNAKGGTELMLERLYGSVPESLINKFQIIPSRLRELEENKKHIYWVHDLAGDPEVAHLKSGNWQNFDKIVFVSNWQQQMYKTVLGVPYSAGTVIKNGITPIESHEKPEGVIRLVYFSTPHRGLDILVNVFSQLAKQYDNIELDIISSFELYGWKERDKPFLPIFNYCKRHPKINYYSSMSNEQIREHLKKCHIFAYPSKWEETSCLCLIEAMSAGLLCVHSSLGALPETSMNLTMMYDYHEDDRSHAEIFYSNLKQAIDLYSSAKNFPRIMESVNEGKKMVDSANNWENKKVQWENLLRHLTV